jgi:predicted DNA-binding protein
MTAMTAKPRFGKDKPRVSVRLGDELAARLDAEVRRRGSTVAAVVREAVALTVGGERDE